MRCLAFLLPSKDAIREAGGIAPLVALVRAARPARSMPFLH